MKRLNGVLIAMLSLNTLISSAAHADCRGDITPSTPDTRFLLHNDGTVTDTQTDLMWSRCSLGQNWTGSTCEGSAGRYDWKSALDNAENTSNAGYSDWRLPNIKELTSILEEACVSPSINTTIFPNTASDIYWSSSPFAGDSVNAWNVTFNNGYDGLGGKSFDNLVRLVRDSN